MKIDKTKLSTKACPKCGNTHLILFSRDNLKVCADCEPYTKIPWFLEAGQKGGFE